MRGEKIIITPLRTICTILVIFSFIAGCSRANEDPGVVVETNQKLSTAPHLFDVYRAANADRAVIFLHGATGTKHYMAYELGLISSYVEGDYTGVNERVILDIKAIAVFPQGQTIQEAPWTFTWSNYVMISGQDDVQFLRDLVSYISAQYGVSKFYIVGHSNGGMMANRLWCEAPDLFDAYIAVAGPPAPHFLSVSCSPTEVKPYLGIIGSQDNVFQVPNNWEDQKWFINPILLGNLAAFVDPVPAVVGERYFLPERVALMCGGTVNQGDADAINEGSLTTWSYCSDSIKLARVEGAGHTITSLEDVSGQSLIDIVVDFISKQ